MRFQELVLRGRFIFSGAPKRLEVFNLVNGKRSARDISRETGRPLTSILRDLQKIKNMGLVFPQKHQKSVFKKEKSIIYEKIPLARQLSVSYLKDPIKAVKVYKNKKIVKSRQGRKSMTGLSLPTRVMILDICRNGEDQLYEFKSPGVEMKVLSKEICAFANTKRGGLIFYGIEDDGTIAGTDRRRQELDQSLQNSIRNTVSPALAIKIVEKDVLGQTIIIIKISSWNRRDVYQYRGRVLIRKGTNVFHVTPDEAKRLHRGEFVT